MTEPRDWDDDRDLPQDIDLDDDGDDTIDCPACGGAIYDDAQQCPACGHWIEEDPSPAGVRSTGWFWPIMVAILVAVVVVLWRAGF